MINTESNTKFEQRLKEMKVLAKQILDKESYRCCKDSFLLFEEQQAGNQAGARERSEDGEGSRG